MRRTVITVLSVAAILYVFALSAAPDNGVAQSQEEAVHKGRTYLNGGTLMNGMTLANGSTFANGGMLANGAYLTNGAMLSNGAQLMNGANLINGCGLVEDRQLALMTLAARPLLQGLSR